MSTSTFLLLLLGLTGQPLETAPTPATRLYVRTVPPGAKIFLDGKPLGTSEGLFLVPSGVAKISIELDGHEAETRRVEIPPQRITRIELVLRPQPEPRARAKPNTGTSKPVLGNGLEPSSASTAASTRITKADLPKPVREAMLTVLRQHPGESRWSGRAGATIFGIAAKPLPSGKVRQRVTPALLELTHLWAVQEVLRAKSLLDRYAATGLTDATTLREAVVEAAGKLHVAGQASGAVHETAVQGDFAVAYVLGEEAALSVRLLQPVELDLVKGAYRDCMHRQAQDLMKRAAWQDALLLWQHLHQRKLVSPRLYLDAARCFKELGQKQDAIRLLTEAIDTFQENASPDFLEEAGDMALAIETTQAEALAERAYRMASERLRDTVSPFPPRADNGKSILPENIR
jgi:hypothetical protein